MSQNISTAVMQRRVEPHDSLDDFPTQPWATRALCEILSGSRDISRETAWEPACGRGHMAKPLKEYFASVHASDVHDYGWEFEGQHRICDFLFPNSEPPHIKHGGVDWIITNPPFRLATEFVKRGLELSRVGVAVFVRIAFLEGTGRYKQLFHPHPPAHVLQFTERVPLVKGRLDATISTATAYCWVVWAKGEYRDTRFAWIPPCRKALERLGDYEASAA